MVDHAAGVLIHELDATVDHLADELVGVADEDCVVLQAEVSHLSVKHSKQSERAQVFGDKIEQFVTVDIIENVLPCPQQVGR